MDSGIAVAIVAALASLGAAFWAYRSAKGARDSADEIYSKNHQISVIDRDADELQAAYVGLVERLAKSTNAEAQFEVLMACRGGDTGLVQAADAYRTRIRGVADVSLWSREQAELRFHYARCQERLGDMRAGILEPEPRREWRKQ